MSDLTVLSLLLDVPNVVPSASVACHDSLLSFITCHDVKAELDVVNFAACWVNRKRLHGSNAISESLESDSPKQMPRQC